MIDGMSILAVVPARGGSKGVPLKNIRPVLGVPLVARVGNLLQEISMIDRAVVSTDHTETARIARESGLDAPFMRPPELSGDRIADWDVLHHALLEVERLDGKTYDIVVMLQPTSPMRKAEHVRDAIEKLAKEGWDSVWSVSKTDLKYHPLKQLRVINDQFEYYDERGSRIVARQQLDTLYHRNGAVYVMTRGCILKQKTIKGRKSGALIIDDEMISIDNLEDFEAIERLLRETQRE
jgi:CMP-N-acetylneuraminic acid synthetase